MNGDQTPPSNRKVDEILRSRGSVPAEYRTDGGNDDQRYQAAIVTDGFPQMGFSVFCNNGQRHGFFYHNMENVDLVQGKRATYLRFSHRGKAASLRGKNLHEVFQAIMEHTLQAVYEYSDAVYPALAEGEPLINRIQIDDMNPKAELPSDEEESAEA